MSGPFKNPRMKKIYKRRTYTTGQIATICDVAPRTASMWIDSQGLEGYRIPGSKDRRVPHKVLIKWMMKNDLPIPPEVDMPSILLGGFNALYDSLMAMTVKLKVREYSAQSAVDSFRCGWLASTLRPGGAILALPELGAMTCSTIRRYLQDEGCVVVAYTTLEDASREQLIADGYDAVYGYNDDVDACLDHLLKLIESKED